MPANPFGSIFFNFLLALNDLKKKENREIVAFDVTLILSRPPNKQAGKNKKSKEP